MRECGGVLGRKARARRLQPPDDPVEVRTSRCRATLDHSEPVGCEDECRQIAPEELGGSQTGPVELRRLRRPRDELHSHLVTDTVARDGKRKRRLGLTETDQLALRARTRRETLRPDVKRLEQVRLPRPVLTDDEHDPG